MGQAAGAADEAVSNAPGFSGRWVNDGGTVIDLRAHDDGRVSGTIRFAADGPTHRLFQLRGTWVEREGERGMVGTVPGWPHPSSTTVWCGELGPDGLLSTKLLTASGPPSPVDWETASGGTAFRAHVVRRRTRRPV